MQREQAGTIRQINSIKGQLQALKNQIDTENQVYLPMLQTAISFDQTVTFSMLPRPENYKRTVINDNELDQDDVQFLEQLRTKAADSIVQQFDQNHEQDQIRPQIVTKQVVPQQQPNNLQSPGLQEQVFPYTNVQMFEMLISMRSHQEQLTQIVIELLQTNKALSVELNTLRDQQIQNQQQTFSVLQRLAEQQKLMAAQSRNPILKIKSPELNAQNERIKDEQRRAEYHEMVGKAEQRPKSAGILQGKPRYSAQIREAQPKPQPLQTNGFVRQNHVASPKVNSDNPRAQPDETLSRTILDEFLQKKRNNEDRNASANLRKEHRASPVRNDQLSRQITEFAAKLQRDLREFK